MKIVVLHVHVHCMLTIHVTSLDRHLHVLFVSHHKNMAKISITCTVDSMISRGHQYLFHN